MAKKYDLTKKSDMRKFQRDLEGQVTNLARNAAQESLYRVNCPHCGRQVRVIVGKSNCPFCGQQIDLTIKF